MAKKKRRHFIKLNNKVKALFGNQPFDKAIASFSDDWLYGLAMILDSEEEKIEFNRPNIIKYLRRVWSESNHSVRKAIVDFLEEQINIDHGQKKDKVDLILSFIENEDATFEEQEEILATFLQRPIAKITEEKVKKRLFYLRMNKILDEYARLLNINFTGNNSIDFYANQTIEIEGEEIVVNIHHVTKMDIELNKLIQEDFSKMVTYLKELKKSAKEQKAHEITLFLQQISTLTYIEPKIIIETFKSIKEPIEEIKYCPIPLKFIKKIVHKFDKTLQISRNSISFLLSKTFTYSLFGQLFEYDIWLDFDKKSIYSSIWTNKIDSILESLERTNSKDIVHFEHTLENFTSRLKEVAYPIDLDQQRLEKEVLRLLSPILNTTRSLHFKDKALKRVLYRFNEEIKPQKEQKKREILLAKTIRDFKKLYPVARSLNREIIFHVGPTNSGKTYRALESLKLANSGYYLAPLRLLALEGYESLQKSGIAASLITGEEEFIDEDSAHISSTIEMLNPDVEVDVCVIDEIQMIADRDRGWAWANALIGAPARKVILTGSEDALEVVRSLAEYLNEPLKVVHFERKSPLEMMKKATPVRKISSNTAIVTFSRKEVLALKSQLSPFFNVSVVYGNLSPEVRREEARRFREGESEVLIATDAIAMGLNLPIKTLLFARDNKFDGLQRRVLTTSEVLQIAGRAGRYGLHESGFIGALDSSTLKTIKEKFHQRLEPIGLPISIMATLEHVLLIGEILQITNLYEILEFFSSNMEFEGPFVAANIDSMMEAAQIIDEYELDLVSKYHLACAPVSLNSPYLQSVFHRYLKLLQEDREVPFSGLATLPNKAVSFSALLNAEDRVKEVSLYLWLSFKFKEKFKDTEAAKEARDKLNRYIERTLKEGNFTKNCKSCGKELDINYKFSICDKCYDSKKRGLKQGRKISRNGKTRSNEENLPK